MVSVDPSNKTIEKRTMFIVGLALLLASGVISWYLRPPADVLGSYLKDNEARRRKMLRDTQEQDDDMGFV